MGVRSSVSARAISLVAVYAARHGLPPDELLRRAAIDPAQASDPDARLPHTAMIRLWHEAAHQSGDADFGLHLAEWLRPEEYLDVLGYVCRASPTLGESYRRAARYFALLHQAVTLQIEEAGEQVRLVHVVKPELGTPARHPIECVLATLLLNGQRGIGRPFLPLSVGFTHPAPPSAAEHRRIFGPQVRFSAPRNELVLPRALLDEPQRNADAGLCAVLERHAEAQLARLPSGGGPLDQTRGCLSRMLNEGGGEPTLSQVAERLRKSPRSLQRHLDKEGTSFRALLDDVRRDLALRHLSEGQLSIGEITFLLGFSEVSAFHRAFRRWTGATPASYRRPS